MSRYIATLEDLHELRDEEAGNRATAHEKTVEVCMGSSCMALGADEIYDAFAKRCTREHGCRKVKRVGCNGLCSQGPFVGVGAEDQRGVELMYQNVQISDVERIAEAIREGTVIEALRCDLEAPFFAYQQRVVLENSGIIDPECIEDYIYYGGYEALFEMLQEYSAEEVVDIVKRSGLRGRGGGGYPTGIKWEAVAKAEAEQKYIVCNGDEGDPGAFMDRSIMESDPHRVIEGMAIGAFACGAGRGYVYVRAEYPLAYARMKKAIKDAERAGILGHNIGGSNFSFSLEMRMGGGAFVCGEATALISSIEGNRGNPRQKPPHLSHHGLWSAPTVLNNVETFANVPPILKNGAEWFAGIGDAKSTGTKVFALSGQIRNTGLIEIPMGTTLRRIIFDIGGGVPEGKSFKAVQTGGPSGGCIPAEHLDIAVTYENLRQIGAMMGSGGMIVMDDSASMVEVARFFMEFCVSESCGKCTPCRVGTTHLHTLLQKFADKQATQADLQRLTDLSEMVREASLCGLGQTAPNPVMSTLRFFESEYLDAMTKDD